MRRAGEDGYALVGAVASIIVFATMSLAVLTATRLAFEDVGAEQSQLQASAAADAGVAMAISGLLADDATQRWPIGGQPRATTFGAARLGIRIEDERGKVALNLLDEERATRLLELAELGGDRLLIARDSLLDWVDTDDEPRPFGAERAFYRAARVSPPNGFLASIGELGLIRGFDAATVARIRPIATVSIGSSVFDPRYADPRVIAIMAEGSENGPAAIERARELAGQRTAIEFTDTSNRTGRPLTIIAEATLPHGARARRQVIVELTGATSRPYVVRSYE